MTQHPITPPFELRNQWRNEWLRADQPGTSMENWLINHASQWGADQIKANIERERQEVADEELEACRQWLEINGAPRKFIDGLLVARCCPEPPSLKEQALKDVDEILKNASSPLRSDFDRILAALKELPDPS